jgi:hypothetical protein
MFLLNPITERYCSVEPRLSDLTPSRVEGDWSLYIVPISEFNCDEFDDLLPSLTQLNFQNTGDQNVQICLGDLQLVK